MNLRRIIKQITPPLLIDIGSQILCNGSRRFKEWEYVPQGWELENMDSKIRGWDVQEVLESYKSKWPVFVKSLEGSMPLGYSPESISSNKIDLTFHNTIMCFAYALALASHQKSRILMLDWGGGIGHYYIFSKAIIPGLEIDYHCRDVPILAEYGQKLFPEAHFYSDDSCFLQKYDFVLASGSLHYIRDWQKTFKNLAESIKGYLFVTRLPIIHNSKSYVYVQRPYKYGYNTEYLSWSINRQEFIQTAEMANLRLIREFVTGERPNIYKAPEQCEFRGYLFTQSSKKRF